MNFQLPEVDNCCWCVPDLRSAVAIIAVLAIVTSPVLSWAIVRHAYIIRVGCDLKMHPEGSIRHDVVDLKMTNILTFGFGGANAGLGPSCFSVDTEITVTTESDSENRNRTQTTPIPQSVNKTRTNTTQTLESKNNTKTKTKEKRGTEEQTSDEKEVSEKSQTKETLPTAVASLAKRGTEEQKSDEKEVSEKTRTEQTLPTATPSVATPSLVAPPEQEPFIKLSTDTTDSVFIAALKYLGIIVILMDIGLIISAIILLRFLFTDKLKQIINLLDIFRFFLLVAIIAGFIYGSIYVIGCAVSGVNIPICEVFFIIFDAALWIYFFIVINSYKQNQTRVRRPQI